VRPGSNIFDQQLKQKKRGGIWRWLGFTTLVFVGAGVGFATMTSQGREAVGMMRKYAPAVIAARQDPELLFTNANSDHVNILLIGRDEDWTPKKVYDPTTKTYRPFRAHDEKAAARSDTMIVLSLDRTQKTIRMVSFPRDALVNLPPNPEGVTRTKLNAAHSYGGPEMLIKTLHDELGLTIHRHAVMKFSGFKKLIDQVGGVDVDVIGALKKDRRTGKEYRGNIDYKDEWGMWEVHLKPGMQHLDGEQAHGYVRFRIDREGDPGRIRRQQQVMRALAKKLMHTSPLQMAPLVNEIRQQFQTDLKDEELAATALFAKNIGDPSKIQPLTLFAAMTPTGDLILNRPKNELLLNAIFGPTFDKRNFLVRSPETKRDDVGPANNASPEALAVLREAGIVDAAGKILRSAGLDVPVRVEDLRLDSSETTPTVSRTRRRRSRVATSSETPAPESTVAETRRPRKTRRRTRNSAATGSTLSRRSHDETPSAAPSDDSGGDARESNDSPAPVPESSGGESSESSHSSEDSSPVPQPE